MYKNSGETVPPLNDEDFSGSDSENPMESGSDSMWAAIILGAAIAIVILGSLFYNSKGKKETFDVGE